MASATTDLAGARARPIETRGPREKQRARPIPWVRLLALTIGAVAFLFPFYYMIVSALQREPNPDISGAFPNPSSLSFAINPTAVFIFRQFFLQLPKEMFEAARIDGASELSILTRVVAPLTRPAILTALLITFIGPWNEFLWPFLITKRLDLEPLAVALANYISTVAQRAANPYGTILAGATVLAVPVVALFLFFQRQFVESSIGSSVKG